MHILVLNASPKGENSVTLQTALYLAACYGEHTFEVLHVGRDIRRLEKDFTPAREALLRADLLLFCYPVYTFIAPYQLHRFLELLKAADVPLLGKYATQLSTSKHFYDVTAHRFIEENCFDLGLRVVRGLSADMDDLLHESGRQEARMFFEQVLFSCAQGDFIAPPPAYAPLPRAPYVPTLPQAEEKLPGDVVIVTNCADEDDDLRAMITDLRAALPYQSRVVDIRHFPFAGGCLGCFGCAADGKCIYRDGFDTFLRTQVQQADAMVYAFAIENHYTHSTFKCFDDRQFCNGHRTVTHGTPVGYLIRGDYAHESNLQMIVQGRSEVGGNYLCAVATDEGDTAADIARLARQLHFAMQNKLRRPANFYGVGGMKIFRDLIYQMQGLMQADHRFYRRHGIYDFPQKKRGQIALMYLVGTLMRLPATKKQAMGKMNDAILGPYRKVIAAAQAKAPNA